MLATYLMLEITYSIATTDAPITLENIGRLSMNGFAKSVSMKIILASDMADQIKIKFLAEGIEKTGLATFKENGM